MDISSVPRINSIVLTGLDFSMKPDRVRYEVEKAFIRPFPEIKVMHQIKTLAIMVYNQQKLTNDYHGNICNGRNALAYFICAVHRLQAPQPQTHTRRGSLTGMASNSSAGSCKSSGRKKNCELPPMDPNAMLPLGYWDSLYYALVAEIRTLHQDLQQRFGFGCENGTSPLHNSGLDGVTHQPVTAIDLASILESAWYALMDSRLVATLDDAVRMRKLREMTAARQHHDTSPDMDEPGVPVRPPVPYGLMDVNDLAPEIITALLWEKHAKEIDKACSENFEDESMMTAYRAEVHRKQMAESMSVSTPLTSAVPCRCHRTCLCKLKCDQSAEGCTCQNRVHLYHLVSEQDSTNYAVRNKYIKQDETVPNRFLGAAPNTLAQLDIASTASSDGKMVEACRESKETVDNHECPLFTSNRKRAHTNNSDLAYVPGPKTSHRRTKDAFPLGFYGRDSYQRYPNILPQSPASPDDPSSFYTIPPSAIKTVCRKPVPRPIVLPQLPQAQSLSHHVPVGQGPTPPGSSPFAHETFEQAGQVTYPSIPQSLSQSMFTQSFSRPDSGNSNDTDQGGYATPFPGSKKSSIHPAEDYISLLSRHPSTTDHSTVYGNTGPHEAFPRLSPPATDSPPHAKSRPPIPHATTDTDTVPALPTLKTFRANSNPAPTSSTNDNKPHPPLPEPDFISPRPAVKQRYVSAGGAAKLADRAEIPGPAFLASAVASPLNSGRGISKEEIDAKLGDAEWVRKNFGESAVSMAVGRASEEGEGEARDRKSSGASRREKLKRVFSRKSSMGEGE